MCYKLVPKKMIEYARTVTLKILGQSRVDLNLQLYGFITFYIHKELQSMVLTI